MKTWKDTIFHIFRADKVLRTVMFIKTNKKRTVTVNEKN